MNSASTRSAFPTCAAVQRSATRGFSLIELLTVVVIISIFAAIALPTVATRLRERRSANVAHQLVQSYRVARMRALGRGSAVMVRYDQTTQGIWVREAIAGSGGMYQCALVPIASCTTPADRWDTAGLYRDIDVFNPFSATGPYEYTKMELRDGANAAKAQVDICFTPSGSAFYRDAFASTAFIAMNFIPTIKVWTDDGTSKFGPDRFVYVLPNGVARIGL